MDINQEAYAIEQEVVEFRRALHRCPETAFHETMTMEYIREHLEEWEISYKIFDPSGIIAVVGNGRKDSIALRADMDALEVEEETGLDLISINKINSKDKLYLSPGMTDESVAFVYCLCDGEITDKYQEDDEDIKAMLISKEEAKNILENEESIDIKAYLMLQIFEKLGESLFI